MRLINKDTDYSVKAVLCIAEQGTKRVSAAELSRNLKIPHPFLRRILQTLGKNGIIKSSKGKGGGFVLARPPEKVFLTDLIRIFQGPVKLAECILDPRACAGVKACQLRKRIIQLQKIVVAELESITLASLVEDGVSLQSAPRPFAHRRR